MPNNFGGRQSDPEYDPSSPERLPIKRRHIYMGNQVINVTHYSIVKLDLLLSEAEAAVEKLKQWIEEDE